MKRILLLLAISTIGTAYGFGQSNTKIASSTETLQRIEESLQTNNAWLEQIETDLSLKQRYKLYPTENIYTFLQLDTKTGQIEQVQWSLDTEKEGSVTINGDDLSYGSDYGSGRFELYPTQNMYQFILLDKVTGRKWHVQWGMEYLKRWIRRIY